MRRLVLPALFLTLAACRDRPPNLDSRGTTIVCFGDSITAGVGADGAPTYPDLLAQRLDADVINAGYPGATAADLLARLPEALAHNPWLVIVEAGGNDMLRRVPVAETEAAVRGLVQGVLAAGAVPMLVEIHAPFGGLGDLFVRLGDEYDVPVVEDVLPEILLDRRLKSDEIHPNAAGYERLAAAVADEVEPLLEARR
ncbi:MAG TPA: GDSL-type esterase/lipase family protein [Thermoanaerobaculia bacterium]|nr:GDSL-type esterase/lipase family protein [Thermoanaerobaculia bacterium]